MQPPDSRPDRWVSLPEAVRILQQPETTLRRMIREGRLEAERMPRNPENPADSRTIYRVRLPNPPSEDAPSESDHPPAPATDPPASVTWYQGKLDERDATIAEKDARIMEQAERIAGLSRELGEATTRAEMLEAERDELARRLAEAEERIRRRWWRFWG